DRHLSPAPEVAVRLPPSNILRKTLITRLSSFVARPPCFLPPGMSYRNMMWPDPSASGPVMGPGPRLELFSRSGPSVVPMPFYRRTQRQKIHRAGVAGFSEGTDDRGHGLMYHRQEILPGHGILPEASKHAAGHTTPTPLGWRTFSIVLAICAVSRSWI